MKFLKVETIFTQDPYYDLFDGGYIKPDKMLEDQKDIDEVKAAIKKVQEFIDGAEAAGILVID